MNKEKMKKVAKGVAFKSLTAAMHILIGLFELVDDMNFLRSHQSLCMGMSIEDAREYLAESEEYHRTYRRAFNRLKKKGWIEAKEVGRLVVETLTESGEIAAIEAMLKHRSPSLAAGEYCMVIFDIPEAAHAARDQFRYMLKRIGFVYHQRSVWCIQKEVSAGIKRIVNILKIDKWVRVYKSHAN
jgi:CRISPR-associated endoribonuclease Cas2